MITVNDDLKNAVVRLGISADKVHVWHQGIDVGQFRFRGPAPCTAATRDPVLGRVIVWVGRMVPVKGLDILLESALLRARGVEYHLYLVGDGPLQRDLVTQVKAHGLSAHITFVGPKLQDELPDWYRAADLTVLPSRSEGLPNVLRESLACGTPFVASDVGGISEIADPDSSLLVPSEDPRPWPMRSRRLWLAGVGKAVRFRQGSRVGKNRQTHWLELCNHTSPRRL